MSSIPNTLFVYGTLLQATNGAIHPLLAGQAGFLGAGSIAGKLFLVQDYPGAVAIADGQSRVFGEVYQLLSPEKLLPALDAYEECAPNFPAPHEYQRLCAPVLMNTGQSLNAWVYLYNLATSQLQLISSGDYRSYLSNPL